MAPKQQAVTDYTTPQGLYVPNPKTIIAKRNPASTDLSYALGTIWVNKVLGTVFILAASIAGVATWDVMSDSLTPVTVVTHALSPYAVQPSDRYIATDSTAGTITINLPNTPLVGRTLTVYDYTGEAATHNVTITTPGGATTISAAGTSGTSATLTTAFESINLTATTSSNYSGQLIT
jgi:hypothetical protein